MGSKRENSVLEFVKIFSAHNFVAPYRFSGATALSVDIKIAFSTFEAKQTSATF